MFTKYGYLSVLKNSDINNEYTFESGGRRGHQRMILYTNGIRYYETDFLFDEEDVYEAIGILEEKGYRAKENYYAPNDGSYYLK
jgi:hypothetical protein